MAQQRLRGVLSPVVTPFKIGLFPGRAALRAPLILDEPTAGLDVMSTRALRRLLGHLRAQGKCIVLSSHIMPEVEQLADHIVIVAHGRSIAEGTAEEIRQFERPPPPSRTRSWLWPMETAPGLHSDDRTRRLRQGAQG